MPSKLEIAIPEEATNEITRMFIDSAQKAFEELLRKQSYPPYLNQQQAADYLGISVGSFKKLNIPKVCLETIERYSKTTLDNYCKENEF